MISYQTNNQHITVCQPFGAIIASHVPPFFHILPLRATPSVFFVALREVFSAPLVWAQTPCFFRTMRNHRVSHLVVGSNLNLLLRSFPKSALKMGNIRQSPSFARTLGTNMYVSSCLPIHTHIHIYIHIYIYIKHTSDMSEIWECQLSIHDLSIHSSTQVYLYRIYLISFCRTHISCIYIYVYIYVSISIYAVIIL